MDNENSLLRVSALSGHYQQGAFGILSANGSSKITLQEIKGLCLHQIAAWPDSINEAGKSAAVAAGVKAAPAPGQSAAGTKASLLRIEPLKWWIYGAQAPDLDPRNGATLDLSHSRTHIGISGTEAKALLNRHLSLDLRDESFPVGTVASTAFHHVGVTLWRCEDRYELFIPRGFALSLWEILTQSAKQFGLEIL